MKDILRKASMFMLQSNSYMPFLRQPKLMTDFFVEGIHLLWKDGKTLS